MKYSLFIIHNFLIYILLSSCTPVPVVIPLFPDEPLQEEELQFLVPGETTLKEIKDKQLTGVVEVGELQVADKATTLRNNFVYGTDGEVLNVAKDPLT